MKKFYSFLVILLALFCAPSTWAETLALYSSETTTNSYIPVNGEYIDTGKQLAQFIYPQADVASLAGQNITALEFYSYWYSNVSFGVTFTIKIMEVAKNSYFPSSSPTPKTTTSATTVYTGTLSVDASKKMSITLNTPYECEGNKDLLIEFSAPKGSTAKTCMFYGKSASGQGFYQKIGKTTTNTKQDFLPRVTFTYEAAGGASSCPKPTDLAVPAANITKNSARITWTKGDASTTTIEYKTTAASGWTVAASSATSPYTLSELTANTAYDVRIKNVCDGEEESGCESASFTTACDVQTPPYSTGFESGDCATGNLPGCWSKIGSPAAANGYYYNTGSQYLQFSGNTEQYAVLPQFDRKAKNLQISFWYRQYYSNDYYPSNLYIGTMTDPTDKSTFTQVKALGRSDSYVQISEESLSSGGTDDYYIAFKYTATSSSAKAFIDDILVEVAPSCTKPSSLSASAASATSINLSWTKGGDETKWNAQYRVGSGAWTAVNNIATTVSGTSCSASISTGISGNTTYEIQVQADCGGEQSSWSSSAEVTTPCEAVSALTWTGGNFESPTYSYGNYYLPGCMDKLSGTGYPNYPYIYSSYYHAGSQCLYFYGGTSTSVEIAIFPQFTQDLNTLLVSLYYQNGTTYSDNTGASYGSLQVGYITDPTDASKFTAVETLPKLRNYGSTATEVAITGAPSGARLAIRYSGGSSAGYLCVDDISISSAPSCFKPSKPTLSAQTYSTATFDWSASGKGETRYQYACVPAASSPSSWTLLDDGVRSKTVEGLTTGTSYKFYVRSYCSAEEQSEAIASDAFTLTCQVPTEVTVSSITNESASVNWIANNGESLWNIQYRKGSGSWTTVNGVTKPYALSGLDANSSYEVKVMCAEGCNSGYSTVASFKTKCETIAAGELPYSNNFEGETVNKLPACWDKISANDYPYITSGSAAYSGSGKCLCFYGNDTETAIMPAFATPLKKLTVKFYYRHSYSDLQIGYVKADGTTFVSKATLPTRSAYDTKQYEVIMDAWGDEAAYIAFRMTNTTSSYANTYIDNVEVYVTPTCFKPASIADATSITSNGATLSWTASGKGETTYQWALAEGSADPEWVDDAAHKVSGTSKEITDLNANTSYTFYVRSYCAADDQSEAVSKAFTTACGVESLPFEYGFENATNVYMPSCWNAHYASGYGAYAYTTNPHTGSKSLNVTAPKTAGSETVVVLPEIDAALNKLGVTFFYRGTAGASIEVGYVTNPNNKATFVKVGDAITVAASYKEAFVSLESLGSVSGNVALRFKGVSGEAYFYIDDIRVARTVTLADNVDNSSLISSLAAEGETIDILLKRKIWMDGYYNTLCLPFSLSADQLADADCPLNNFNLKVFDYTRTENDEVHMYITGASSIEAGVPYFASYKGTPTSDKTEHLFRDVKVTATSAGEKTSEIVTYKGFYTQTVLANQSENASPVIFYLSRNNTIYWPDQDVTLNGFRAYFAVDYSAGAPARPIRRICFADQQEDTATGVDKVESGKLKVENRKFIENGQLYIIRDGEKYTVLGQKIQ